MGNCATCQDQQHYEYSTEVNLQKQKWIQENGKGESQNPVPSGDDFDKENYQQQVIRKSDQFSKGQMSQDPLLQQPQQHFSPLKGSRKFEGNQNYGFKAPTSQANRGGLAGHGANPHIRYDLRKLEIIPDFSNEFTRDVLQKLGDFVYDDNEPSDLAELPLYGPVEMENNAFYIGQWKNGMRWGRGQQVWSDGSQYEGYWTNDMANGQGRLIHADGDVFEGQWLNDKAHGKGVYIHRDGASYTGEWYEDKQHGFGIEKWVDGASYEGNYYMGMKHGHGYFMWADGSTYRGEFQNNNIHGTGLYKWADLREYEGDWRDNKMHGKGIFLWQDGRRYEGEYIDDKKHGYGEFFWPDGRIYQGYWENGKQHGRGVYKGTTGIQREGEWRDGKKIRWLDE